MKRIMVFSSMLIMALNLTNCNPKDETVLMTGDLVFVEGDTADAGESAIMRSTGEMSHVGIVEVSGDSIMVVDATSKGVRRQSMEEFNEAMRHQDGSLPMMHFRRLKDNSDVECFVETAKTHIGCQYDYAFMPGNDRFYCSELVYEAYVRDGVHLLQARPMNFRNPEGGFDQYWIDLFDKQGMSIPQDTLGTNPTDMFKDPALMEINLTR